MIGRLSGKIIHLNPNYAIVEVSGVGYRVFMMDDEISKRIVGEEISLWIHTWVRENALELYGFAIKEELDFFELLISISGIGAKTAMSILTIAPPETLKKAISTGNTSYLTKVSGIGKKNAEKIVLELRGKLGSLSDGETGPDLSEDTDALLALQSLGYGKREAREALLSVSAETKGMNQRIKEALKHLGK